MSKKIKSAIKEELLAVCGLEDVVGNDAVHEELREELVRAVGDLADAEWEALSAESQDWFNDAADAMNSKKATPDFPDAEVEAEKPSRTRGAAKAAEPAAKPSRTRGAAKAAEPAVPKVGDLVVVTTSRGKVIEGELVEIDGDVIVVSVAGDEQEFQRARVISVELKDAGVAKQSDDDVPEDYAPAVGDVVVVTTKRGKAVTGEVVELDDGVIVIAPEDEDEQEFQLDRLESVVLAAEPAAKPSRTRGAAKAAEPAAKPAAEKKNTKTTAADNGGISATTRMRELICDDLEASAEDINKLLLKEKIQFKDNTLKLVYADVHKVVTMLKARKLLK